MENKSKTYAESVLNSMTDGVGVLDLEGNIIDANPAFVRMLGYKNKQDFLDNATPLKNIDENISIKCLLLLNSI